MSEFLGGRDRHVGLRWLSTALLLLMSSSQSAHAESQSDTVRAVLQERLPQIQIEKVQSSPWPGLLEVVTASEVVYSDVSGDLLFIGKIIDTKKREDLTEKRWNQLQRIDFKSLPFDKSIKIVKGNGSRKLAVFEDPHCPYCVRFEKALDGVDDVTIYLFLYPIESLHPNATAAARNIWCAQNRAEAWSGWMLKKIEAPVANCNGDPVADIVALGETLKVVGTPTLFFESGNRIPGALTTEQIQQALAEQVAAN
jgi:thiol:disulfide interchange protein DsbC